MPIDVEKTERRTPAEAWARNQSYGKKVTQTNTDRHKQADQGKEALTENEHDLEVAL